MTQAPNMRWAHKYSPITHAEVYEVRGNRVYGIAVPASGDRPCAVTLAVKERTFGVSAADCYAERAKADGFRLGWCGFEVYGVEHAMAVGSSGELRCAATGRQVAKLDVGISDGMQKLFRAPRTVEQCLASVRSQTGVTRLELDNVWPFAEACLEHLGITAFVDASYRYFLGRGADVDGLGKFNHALSSGSPARFVWDEIMASSEFGERGASHFAGPFDPTFTFGLKAFDRADEVTLGRAQPTQKTRSGRSVRNLLR